MRSGFAIPAVFLCASALTGCAGSNLEGTVNGEEFGGVESAFFIDESTEDFKQLRLVLATWSDGCATYSAYVEGGAEPVGEGPFNALSIFFQLYDPIVEGTYPIVANGEFLPEGNPPETINAQFFTYADDVWSGPSAQSGSIDVKRFETAVMEGAVSVTLSTGETLEGNFEAEVCSSGS